jgi:hypothetical protein
MERAAILLLILAPIACSGAEPAKEPPLIAKPEAFESLLHPNCSHCVIDAERRRDELRVDDRVLAWIQVQADGYVNDGAIPLRFFLSDHRFLDDGWGLFVYDPDAGFAYGFAAGGGPYRFQGWCGGVMVIKGGDGMLYSSLSGNALDGPRRGTRLQSEPSLVSDWGFWRKQYPRAVAFTMYDKFKPVVLPTAVSEDSRKSRGPADTMVLGVWDGSGARAYPLDALEKAVVVHETVIGVPRVVIWYGPTKTAAAFRQPWGTSGLAGEAGSIFSVDHDEPTAPFVDKRLARHWDITGRARDGGPKLVWIYSVQVKWYAWAAEYPEVEAEGRYPRFANQLKCNASRRDASASATRSATPAEVHWIRDERMTGGVGSAHLDRQLLAGVLQGCMF